MSVWGPGIFQNDISDDVRNYFRDQLHRGKTAQQITQELMLSFQDALKDVDDGPNFWLALADVQWDMGRLIPAVREQALASLSDGSAFLPWAQSSQKNIKKRRQVLERLAEKLNSDPPPEKKVSQYRLYQCPWNVGDVFAFPLKSEWAKASGLFGCWLLLEKIGEREYHPGHQIPVMYAKILPGQSLPNSTVEYDKLKYIKLSNHRYDLSRFKYPDPSDCSNLANMIRGMDENGYLAEYRFAPVTTSNRSIPKDLVYVGNFADATHPEKEYITQWEVEIISFFWKELEEKLLWSYVNIK